MKKAFTMAEAILVMTILGIIATIMISTLKPAEFKDKGMAIMAKKVLSELDTATTNILINNSADGTMANLYQADTSNTFATSVNSSVSNDLGKLYKKYLTATRQECTNAETCQCGGYTNKFFLKDGACVGITTGSVTNAETWFPGETGPTNMTAAYGVLFFDTNGNDEPNVKGKDQFLMPFDKNGIQFAND